MDSKDSANGGKVEINFASQDCNFSQFGTPTKESVEKPQLSSTSQKRKLEFDFWACDRPPSSSKTKFESDTKETINISDLKPGIRLQESLQFRVSYKSKPIMSKNGPMFKFHALDYTGEIVIMAFPEATKKWYNSIEINKVYKLEHFDVKEENQSFKSNTGHDLEVNFNRDSVLSEIADADYSAPQIRFKFLPLKEIQDSTTKQIVDAMGIFVHDYELEKDRQPNKRDLCLIDKSKVNFTVTLWGKAAEEFDEKLNSVFVIRKGSTSPYMGKSSLNIFAGTLLWVNPPLEDADDLKTWFVDLQKKRTQVEENQTDSNAPEMENKEFLDNITEVKQTESSQGKQKNLVDKKIRLTPEDKIKKGKAEK